MFNFIFTADKASKKPLYEQLYSYVADEIKNKNIKENERMPSKKALAKYLGISVNTVETAYSILVQEGQLQGAVFMFARLIFLLVTETLNMKKNKIV